MHKHEKLALAVLGMSLVMISGCGDLVPRDLGSLLIPRFTRSEVVGFVAGFGTTFATVPDLVAVPFSGRT